MAERVIKKLPCGATIIPGCGFDIDSRGWTKEIDYVALGFRPIVRDLIVKSHRGVLRGIHFQDPNVSPLTKFVRCLDGYVVERLVDLRTGRIEEAFDLCQDDVLIIPPWCATGYYVPLVTAILLYGFDGPRVESAERAISWKCAEWDTDDPILSDRDANAPSLDAVLAQLTGHAI